MVTLQQFGSCIHRTDAASGQLCAGVRAVVEGMIKLEVDQLYEAGRAPTSNACRHSHMATV